MKKNTKNIFIILISVLLCISVAVNVSTFTKLNKSYEKINEAIASDYLKIDEALVNLNNKLKENENLSHKELITLYENFLSSEKENSIYRYAMDINIFKWINENYSYANLDLLAQYITYLKTTLNDTSSQNIQEIRIDLMDLYKKWQSLHIKKAIINNTYDFQTDPKKLSKSLKEFNDYCYNCIDKKNKNE